MSIEAPDYRGDINHATFTMKKDARSCDRITPVQASESADIKDFEELDQSEIVACHVEPADGNVCDTPLIMHPSYSISANSSLLQSCLSFNEPLSEYVRCQGGATSCAQTIHDLRALRDEYLLDAKQQMSEFKHGLSLWNNGGFIPLFTNFISWINEANLEIQQLSQRLTNDTLFIERFVKRYKTQQRNARANEKQLQVAQFENVALKKENEWLRMQLNVVQKIESLRHQESEAKQQMLHRFSDWENAASGDGDGNGDDDDDLHQMSNVTIFGGSGDAAAGRELKCKRTKCNNNQSRKIVHGNRNGGRSNSSRGANRNHSSVSTSKMSTLKSNSSKRNILPQNKRACMPCNKHNNHRKKTIATANINTTSSSSSRKSNRPRILSTARSLSVKHYRTVSDSTTDSAVKKCRKRRNSDPESMRYDDDGDGNAHYRNVKKMKHCNTRKQESTATSISMIVASTRTSNNQKQNENLNQSAIVSTIRRPTASLRRMSYCNALK
mmetsp:Transcript_50130/g.83484  ORF Transcript_50130/g.83484 Transcript_50130/m.83484 type:complete len:498 (+) Transcript_50130:47-1540(+)